MKKEMEGMTKNKINRNQVRKMVLKGLDDVEIAKRLMCSPNTIQLIRSHELRITKYKSFGEIYNKPRINERLIIIENSLIQLLIDVKHLRKTLYMPGIFHQKQQTDYRNIDPVPRKSFPLNARSREVKKHV